MGNFPSILFHCFLREIIWASLVYTRAYAHILTAMSRPMNNFERFRLLVCYGCHGTVL